jgi:aldose 1-epimerase
MLASDPDLCQIRLTPARGSLVGLELVRLHITDHVIRLGIVDDDPRDLWLEVLAPVDPLLPHLGCPGDEPPVIDECGVVRLARLLRPRWPVAVQADAGGPARLIEVTISQRDPHDSRPVDRDEAVVLEQSDLSVVVKEPEKLDMRLDGCRPVDMNLIGSRQSPADEVGAQPLAAPQRVNPALTIDAMPVGCLAARTDACCRDKLLVDPASDAIVGSDSRITELFEQVVVVVMLACSVDLFAGSEQRNPGRDVVGRDLSPGDVHPADPKVTVEQTHAYARVGAMESPSGRAAVLRSGAYEAEVVEVGAGLRLLRRDGYDVVAGYPADQMCSGGRGQLLIPWPNRIEDGRYEFQGKPQQLPLSEPAKANASHGLVRWVSWRLEEHTSSRARWVYRLAPQPGYPYLLDLSIEYALASDGLHVSIRAHNIGEAPAPYGAGAHPYLSVGRRIDECVLTLPATTRYDTDARGLPTTPASVDGSAYDFRSPHLVGTTTFDHPFGGLQHHDGVAAAILRDPDSGREARLSVDSSYRWLQVFSGESLSRGARESIAIEPMTCPPNAFRSGIDLVTLQPGGRHTAGFTIS